MLKTLVPIIVQISLILLVVSIGLASHWREVTYAFRRPGLRLRGVGAVNVVVPLVAVVLALWQPMAPATVASRVRR